MSTLKLFGTITGYTVGFLVLAGLFVVAMDDLADEESETSMVTKAFEFIFALAFVGALLGGLITLVVLCIRWVIG